MSRPIVITIQTDQVKEKTKKEVKTARKTGQPQVEQPKVTLPELPKVPEKWSTLSANDLKLLLSSRSLTVAGSKDEMIRKLMEYDHWERFTIKELKSELGNRNLPISGSKDELIQRLIEGGKEDQTKAPTKPAVEQEEPTNPKKKQKKEDSIPIATIQAIPVNFPIANVVTMSAATPNPTNMMSFMTPAQVQSMFAFEKEEAPAPAEKKAKKRKASALEQRFANLTVYELKAALAERDLKVSGTKEDLLERLVDFEEWNCLTHEALETELTSRGMPIGGTKKDLIARILVFEELKSKSLAELKAELASKNLSCTGNKDELIQRLFYCKGKR